MNIIITGASRGIGYDTCLQLVRSNAIRLLALSRNTERLKGLKEACEVANEESQVDILSFDLSNIDEQKLLAKVETWGKVDILIHNAGLLINKPFAALTSAEWKQIYQVNLFGVVQLTRLLLPYLSASETPHILNISSMGGFQGSSKFPGLSAYSSSKADIANLTECIAEEFKTQGIKLNCLALGAAQTEMLAAAFPGYQAPLSSQEMAEFIAYFATQGHRFFNGKILPVSVSTP